MALPPSYRVIIDGNGEGLADAVEYYRRFPREPSKTPLWDMNFTPDDIVVLPKLGHSRTTLEQVLEVMIEQATKAPSGPVETLIVCHGDEGLILPITDPPSSQAQPDQLKKLREVSKHLETLKMPCNEEGDSEKWNVGQWIQLAKQLDPNAKFLPIVTLEEVKQGVNKWTTGTFGANVTVDKLFGSLIPKINKVRKREFNHIEFRACNLARGDNPVPLQIIGEFFNAFHVIGPKVGTFYLPPFAPGIVPDGNRRLQLMQTTMSPQGRDWYTQVQISESQRPTVRRWTDAARTAAQSGPSDVMVRIWEVAPFRYQATAAAASTESLRVWVDKNVMDHNFGHGTFQRYNGQGAIPLAGFWTFGEPEQTQPFILPGEIHLYRQLLVHHSPFFKQTTF